MNIRLRRLANDHDELRRYAAAQDRVSIRSASGEPPEKYQIEYRLRGLELKGGEVVERSTHLVEIVLPLEYPTIEPKCRMLTPVFHPNISPQVICHTDHWAAGESLVDVVVRIGEMISYQNYNVKSPRNGEAARWAESHLSRFPVDPVSLAWTRPQTEGEAPPRSEETAGAPETGAGPEGTIVDAGPQDSTCANCGAKGPAAAFLECSKRHRVCADCVLTCAGCGKRLCVLCSFFQCSSCKAVLCEECAAYCPSCGRPFCPAHRRECAACRTATCPDCGLVCPSCRRFLCRTHFRAADGLCADCLESGERPAAPPAPDRSSPSSPTARCPKCGKANDYWNASFCPFCGARSR